MKNAFTVLIWFLAAGSAANAQVDQIFAGTRPLSMGGAYLAIADDGYAIQWNPAGLARMERIQATFGYSDLFGIGIDSYYASFITRLYFIPPLTDYLTVGADWFGLKSGNDDDELRFRRDLINLSVGFRPPRIFPFIENFSLGANVKYLQLDASLNNGSTEIDAGLDASGWGWDFGALYNIENIGSIPGALSLGVMLHDGGGTKVRHHTGAGGVETVQRQNLRWGMSYRPFEHFPGRTLPINDPVFAIDVDERVHFGLEFWLQDVLAVRAGWQKDLHTDEQPSLSFGLGLKASVKDWPEAKLDYALTDMPVLPTTNKQFGATIIFREDPRLIRIEEAHVDNVFASLYRHYGMPGANFGRVKMRNVYSDTLRVWITFENQSYVEEQKADTVVIAPSAVVDVPIRAVFSPNILQVNNRRLSGQIRATYELDRTVHSSVASIDFAVYGRNYLTWDDPGKSAAFVTFDDPLIVEFVDQAIEQAVGFKIDGLNKNCWLAIALFDALRTYGLRYRLDPLTPFPSLADTLSGSLYRTDQIKYPAELLSGQSRFGDCDDLSILYATVLQNAGISTALVSGPGHVFLAFDTSIPASQLKSLPFPPRLFVIREATLWIPIEATMLPNSSFADSWESASSKFRDSEAAEVWKFFEIAKSQIKYPPVSAELLPFPRAFGDFIPDLTSPLREDSLTIVALTQNYLQSFTDSLALSLSREAEIAKRNQYGVILGHGGEYHEAGMQFRASLAKDATFAPAWHNLGNIEFILGNFASADSFYHRAADHNLFNRGTYLNLAILYQIMKFEYPQDSTYYQLESDKAMLRAAQILEGDLAGAYVALGLAEVTTDTKAEGWSDKATAMLKKVKNYVDRWFKKFAQKQTTTKVALDTHGTKGADEVDENRAQFLAWQY